MAKRFYWLKLPDTWFQQKAIKKLRRIAGGDTYTIIYLKMLLAAIKQDGKLFFEGVEENFYEELALEIDEEPENVKVALSYLFSQHLIELVDSDEYSLPEAKAMTGSESASAERMRRMRDKRASQCDIGVTQQLRLGDVEKEIEIEKRDIKTSCPEPDKSGSGPQPTTNGSTVDNGVKEIDTAADIGVKEVDANAGMMVEKAAGPSPEVLYQLPTNRGDMFDITSDYVGEMQELYPAIDVKVQFLKMKAWLINNPKNRKTKSGMKRFINGWLSREQDIAPRVEKKQQQRSKNSFNNYEQREYDWEEMEQKLIQASHEEMFGKGGQT